LPSETGSVPLISVFARFKVYNSVRLPYSDGIDPVKELFDRLISSIPGKSRKDGSVPVRLLLDKSIPEMWLALQVRPYQLQAVVVDSQPL
jgi:hypothetical protein